MMEVDVDNGTCTSRLPWHRLLAVDVGAFPIGQYGIAVFYDCSLALCVAGYAEFLQRSSPARDEAL